MEIEQPGWEMQVNTVQHDTVRHIVEEIKNQIREGSDCLTFK